MSYLTLYVSKYLQKGKNFLIESFANYLATLNSTKVSIDKFQYIRPLKVITIKLDMAQLQATPFPTNQYNYLDLQLAGSSDTTHYYYFITHKVQKASQTIELTCEMDVLNTFQWNIDYKVDNKTLVVREHQDRFFKKTSPLFPMHRNIPLRSEGINAPLYKVSEDKILQGESNIKWILYYRNKDAYQQSHPEDFTLNNPVECYIAPSEPVSSRYGTANTTINEDRFTNNMFYYLLGGYQISISGTTYPATYYQIQKTASGLTISMCLVRLEMVPGTQTDPEYEEYIYQRVVLATNVSSFDIVEPVQTSVRFYYWNTLQYWINDIRNITHSADIIIAPTTISFLLDPSSIDRTDSRNIKIIELPYAPTDIEYDSINDEYIFDGNWEYDSTQKLFKLVNLNTKFKSVIHCLGFNPMDETIITSDMIDTPSASDDRQDIMESKIYHSDYYRPKFVYDSFSLTFQLENITDLYYTPSLPFDIEFYVSSNVISKFLFMFPEYKTNYGVGDFDNVVAVSRNNEQVIYNSQYLNYIRNGYNYDLKSKQRTEEAGGIGLGISIASTILGVAGSIAAGSYGTAILAGVGGALTIANQSVNYAKSVAQNEQNIQEKIQQARMQAVNVMNADDIDLLNAYCDNKAKWCMYKISPTMQKALLDMFYYAGYSTNEQKIPDITTRYWFNYLQCELVLEVANNKAYLSDEIEEELKNRFKDGVTFFHYKNGSWDLDQIKENYESWILS